MTQLFGLDKLADAIGKQIVTDAWKADAGIRAEKVARYRAYMDGDHEFEWMSDEQRDILGLKKGDEFLEDHTENIVQTFADRLLCNSVEGDSEQATAWAANVLDWNRFKRLQLDVHEAAIIDGNAYLLIEYDDENQIPILTLEPAFDGVEGMEVIYHHGDEPLCALKMWHEVIGDGKMLSRLNVYYADRIEKYASKDGGKFSYYYSETDQVADENGRQYIPFVLDSGAPIGVPVIPFRHGYRKGKGYGLSLLEKVIPLQNVQNRTLHSMVAAEELSAFQIRWIKGMPAPTKIAPGMFLEFVPRDGNGNPTKPSADIAEWLKAIDLGAIEQGEIAPHLAALQYTRAAMYKVSGTPDYDDAGGNASGESLKQREMRLLGRIRRAHAYFGSAWEDAIYTAHRVQQAFGTAQPPAARRWYARWKDAQVRSDREVVENAVDVADRVPKRRFLQMIAPVFGWDEGQINQMIEELTEEQAAAMQQAINTMSGFGGGGSANGDQEGAA